MNEIKIGDTFKIGDILLVINDVLAEEAGIEEPYLSKGSKLRIVNVFDRDVHALLLSVESKSYQSPDGIFMIIQDDVDNGDVVSLSQMRNGKIQTILQ